MKHHEEPDQETVNLVLSYFIHNPNAADTLEGVTRWRLMDELIRRNVEDTDLALRWLVAERFLNQSVSPGVGQIFSLNRDMADEAKKFLKSAEPSKHRRKS